MKGIKMKGTNKLVLSHEALIEALDKYINNYVFSISHYVIIKEVILSKRTKGCTIVFEPKTFSEEKSK